MRADYGNSPHPTHLPGRLTSVSCRRQLSFSWAVPATSLTHPLFSRGPPTVHPRAVTQFSSILGTCAVLSYFDTILFVISVTFSVLVSRVTTFLGKYLLETKTTACAPISTNSSRP